MLRGRNLLLALTIVLLFSLLTVGAYVTVGGYGGRCGVNTPEDWPLCNGMLLPPPDFGSVVEYTHRIFASLSGLFLVLTAVAFWRAKDAPSWGKRLVYLALLAIFAEIALGGAVVNTGLSPELVTAHQALALLVFGLTVAAGGVVFRKS